MRTCQLLALYFLAAIACPGTWRVANGSTKGEMVHPMPQLQMQDSQAPNAAAVRATPEGKKLTELHGPRRLGRVRSHSESEGSRGRMAIAHRGGSAGGFGGGGAGGRGFGGGGGVSEARPHPKRSGAMPAVAASGRSLLTLVLACGVVLSVAGYF